MIRNFIRLGVLTLVLGFLVSCSKEDIEPDPMPPDEEEVPLKFPKKEMRGVWMATVWGLDWPQGQYDAESQKKLYTDYLDLFQSLNINAIFFQVKGMGDAFYDSPYEDWSQNITGTRGQDPGYDVLEFLISEAHARHIQFHAWLNPYRIATRAGAGTAYPELHPSVDPDWVVNHEKIQIYNPALPEVRQRLVDIVKDLITKYDVDGVHFDDYFYPSPTAAGQMISDQGDYEQYGQDYPSIQDFRRANVDRAIEGVYEAIVETRPEVVFSISPAPSHDYNYGTLFADVRKWCQEGWVDLVIPQLYQEIGNPFNDFQNNLNWWSQYHYEAALMVGHGFYKFGDANSPAAFHSTRELADQFAMTRRNEKVVGNVLYSAQYIPLNRIGITDRLEDLYQRPALIPPLGRSVLDPPAGPSDVRAEGDKLKWSVSGDERSVVYYFADREEVGVILAITDHLEWPATDPGYYVVSTINADNTESPPSVLVRTE